MMMESKQLSKVFNKLIPELINSGIYSEDIIPKYVKFAEENLPIEDYFREEDAMDVIQE